MRVLLDESLPRDLALLIVGHEAVTVQAAGWSGVTNGKLLALAATQFDVFLTADRNIEFQQNLKTLPVSIVVLRARNNRIQALEPLLPELLQLLNHMPARTLCKIGI
jgi:predicted nuclease of predicted toxin-antitoxin system